MTPEPGQKSGTRARIRNPGKNPEPGQKSGNRMDVTFYRNIYNINILVLFIDFFVHIKKRACKIKIDFKVIRNNIFICVKIHSHKIIAYFKFSESIYSVKSVGNRRGVNKTVSIKQTLQQ